MHTDSSAMPTCLRLRSTVECTATVRMPMAWQARRMRSAISPRLAIRIFLNGGMLRSALADYEQRLVKFDRLTVFDQHRDHFTSKLRLNLIEHLHGFDQAQGVTGIHLAADPYKSIRL